MIDVTYTTFYKDENDKRIKGTLYNGSSLKDANEMEFLSRTRFDLYKGDMDKWKRELEAIAQEKRSKYNYY